MSKDLSDHIIDIDHVTLLTPQVDLLSKMYSDALGFTIGPSGIIPDQNLEFNRIVFSQGGILEIVGPQGEKKKEILDGRFGPESLALRVDAIDSVFTKLSKWGHTVSRPNVGTTNFSEIEKPPDNLWSAMGFMESAVPGDCIYFMQQNEEAQRQLRDKYPKIMQEAHHVHKNTAKRIAAVWILVLDLEYSVKLFENVGLGSGQEVELGMLDLIGKEIIVGQSKLFAVQPNDVESFVESARGQSASELEGIIGLSLEVQDLLKAQEVIRQGTRLEYRTYDGPFGRSILLHPDVTGGLLLEIFTGF